MNLNSFEKIAIISILIIGLLGGVALVYFQQPPIISSIFIALGISTVVYHFLGGIQLAEFNMGPIKLGGSIAALIASAWLIDTRLESQAKIGEASINKKHELFDSNKKLLGTLPIEKYNITLGNIGDDIEVYLSDSIKLGELNYGDLKLNRDDRITTLDSINLGKIKKTDFHELGMFSDFNISKYTEIKYKLRLGKPFESKRDSKYWYNNPTKQDFETIYENLPFTIKPVYRTKGGDQTEVTTDGGKTTYHPLVKGEDESIKLYFTNNDDDKPSIYIVRIGTLIKDQARDSFKNSVIYQVFGFSTIIKPD